MCKRDIDFWFQSSDESFVPFKSVKADTAYVYVTRTLRGCIFENGQQCRHETAFNQSHTLRGIGSDDRRQELTSSKEDESAVLLIKVVDVLFPLP